MIVLSDPQACQNKISKNIFHPFLSYHITLHPIKYALSLPLLYIYSVYVVALSSSIYFSGLHFGYMGKVGRKDIEWCHIKTGMKSAMPSQITDPSSKQFNSFFFG